MVPGDAALGLSWTDEQTRAFARALSHELRTPLAAMRGFAELFAAGKLGPISHDQQGCVDDMVAACRQAAATVEDAIALLTLGSALRGNGEPGRGAPVSVTVVATDAVSAARASVGAGAGAVELRCGPHRVAADDGPRAMRILGRALAQALHENDGAGQIILSATADGRWVELRIDDPTRTVAAASHADTLMRMWVEVARGLAADMGAELEVSPCGRLPFTLRLRQPAEAP